MSEIKWIKLTTDVFDNRKVKHLRKLPDGDTIALFWLMLLTIAGRCNDGGRVFLTENLPYTSKMLADETDIQENTVKLALEYFNLLKMTYMDGKFIAIAGWEEYQNVEGMEQAKELKRLRNRRYYQKKKLLSDAKTSYKTPLRRAESVQSDVLDIELEEERDKEQEHKSVNATRFTPPSEDDVNAYCKEKNYSVNADRFIAFYESKGWMVGKNKMKDWKAAVRGWATKDAPEPPKENKWKAYDRVDEVVIDGVTQCKR